MLGADRVDGDGVVEVMMAFQVPERYRVRKGPMASHAGYGNNGAFIVPCKTSYTVALHIVASDGEGWEHISVSLPDRCSTWAEMCHVKGLFWSDEDTVIQYHPPKSAYVNAHPYCLHLWRPIDKSIPVPPAYLVGPIQESR